METLTINIPDNKSAMVKQVLKDLGVTIERSEKKDLSEYKKRILKISVWTDEDLKAIEDAGKAFNSLKPATW